MKLDLNILHSFYECNLDEYERKDILIVTQAFLKLMGRPDTKPYKRVFANFDLFKQFVFKDWLGFPQQKKFRSHQPGYGTKKGFIMSNNILTDTSLMPYGKYKEYKMANVPPDYLLWLWENDKCSDSVRKYIEDNKHFLELETKQNRKQQNR